VLRTERDEANAPVTATNYASTELNLKDRRRECSGGEKRGGTIYARRPRDMIYDARRDLVFATTKFRHRDARRSVAGGQRYGWTDRWKSPGMISLPD